MERRTGRPRSKRSASLAVAVVAGLTALVSAPAAHAGPLVTSADGCPTIPLEQPFQPWLDPSNYVLVPNGTFERGGSHWSLDGAGVVSGNEPYYVHGDGETKSLSIGSGGSATSGTMCVGLNEPTLRLFVRSSRPSSLSKLKVEVLFEDATGTVQSLPIGTASALTSTSWNPSLPMVIE